MGTLHAVLGLFVYLIGSALALRVRTWLDFLELCHPRSHFSGVEGVALFSPTKSFHARPLENTDQLDQR
jgi:hypothetical protein